MKHDLKSYKMQEKFESNIYIWWNMYKTQKHRAHYHKK